MDDTGMTEAEKVGLVEDVLAIWGEDAARELAAHYGVALQALELARPLRRSLLRRPAPLTLVRTRQSERLPALDQRARISLPAQRRW